MGRARQGGAREPGSRGASVMGVNTKLVSGQSSCMTFPRNLRRKTLHQQPILPPFPSNPVPTKQGPATVPPPDNYKQLTLTTRGEVQVLPPIFSAAGQEGSAGQGGAGRDGAGRQELPSLPGTLPPLACLHPRSH